MGGDSPSSADVAQGAAIAATSTNAEHTVKNIVDGDAQSFWASGNDPTAPVDVQLDFGAVQQITSVQIEWEHPAQAFELQVASGGKWTSVYTTSGNNVQTTRYLGPSVSGSAMRIRMTRTHPTLGNVDGHAIYGIRNLRVVASSARVVVQDCVEAEGSPDARDKFFMVAVPEFDPIAASAAKQNAALLTAAQKRLGAVLAELYVAMPSLAACGFKASFAKPSAALTQQRTSTSHADRDAQGLDASVVAVAAVAPAMGLDMAALQELVSNTRDALTKVSH